MTAQISRDWVGLNTFAPATQTKLLELLGRLKQKNVDTLTILVMGKGGVGKSSTVNSIIGERAVTINPFQSEGLRPTMVSRTRTGFTLNIIDTPGLIEGGYINSQALEIIKQSEIQSVELHRMKVEGVSCLLGIIEGFLLNKTIDILLYVDRLDSYRVDNLDKLVVRAITDSFGKEIWSKALIVLTHAQFSPPDGLPYEEFFSKRSEALLKTVCQGARLKKGGKETSNIPVILVENSGRCNKNENDEKVIPNGISWIPNLVQTITEVALSGSKSIHVDKKLIEGPNPNERGKILIPLIFALQFLFVIKPIERAIKNDIKRESRPSWEVRDASAARRNF